MKILIAILTLALASCAPSLIDRTVSLGPDTVYVPTVGDEMGTAMKLLSARLVEGGYTVDLQPEEVITRLNQGEWAYGLHFRQFKIIALNSSVPVNAQFETLAHEAGHIFHSWALREESYGASEVFAEIVGNRVQQFYGSKTAKRTSSEYLAAFKHALVYLPYLERDIEYGVRVLTGRAEWPTSAAGERQ